MLSSIAAIATAITALIGIGYKVYSALKKARREKESANRQEIAELLKGAKSDDERKKYSKLLHDIDSK